MCCLFSLTDPVIREAMAKNIVSIQIYIQCCKNDILSIHCWQILKNAPTQFVQNLMDAQSSAFYCKLAKFECFPPHTLKSPRMVLGPHIILGHFKVKWENRFTKVHEMHIFNLACWEDVYIHVRLYNCIYALAVARIACNVVMWLQTLDVLGLLPVLSQWHQMWHQMEGEGFGQSSRFGGDPSRKRVYSRG